MLWKRTCKKCRDSFEGSGVVVGKEFPKIRSCVRAARGGLRVPSQFFELCILEPWCDEDECHVRCCVPLTSAFPDMPRQEKKEPGDGGCVETHQLPPRGTITA